MSATVCETALHTQHIHDHHAAGPQRPGRYRWPSFNSLRGGSSSSSRSRQSALRVVSSETTPTPDQKPSSSSPAAPVRASSDCPSLDASAPADEAEAVREQARLPESEADEPTPLSSVPASAPKPAKTHVRAKSTTAVGEPSSNRLDSPSARTSPRARASSSATMATQPRSRTRARLPSMLSSVLTNPRAAVQTRMASTAESELVGSFAPTSSPRERLLSLLATGSVAPSPAPSAPSSPRYASLRLSTDHMQRANLDSSKRSRRRTASTPFDSPSPPSPLPSICRTPSSYSGSEYFPTAPSSAGPATPVHTTTALPLARKSESLHPVLEGLERTSMFAVQTACATCGRGGSNFPCCPKCGEMWCSRACRLQKGNGKRHICSRRA